MHVDDPAGRDDAPGAARVSDVVVPASFDPWPDSDVHLEWGVIGAALAAQRGDAVVIVDVLSFSTTLSIATAREFTCLVYSGAEIAELGGAASAADRFGARPLSTQRRVGAGELSLSPATLVHAEPRQRVLFTSLNGAASAAASACAPALLVAGLRNVSAAAHAAADVLVRGVARRITVVASGEQWSSVAHEAEGLRPGVEDWLGAGLLCRSLTAAGLRMSAEASAAAAAWTGPDVLRQCVSARELVAAGFGEDVELALDVDADVAVPMRDDTEPTGRVFVGRRPS